MPKRPHTFSFALALVLFLFLGIFAVAAPRLLFSHKVSAAIGEFLSSPSALFETSQSDEDNKLVLAGTVYTWNQTGTGAFGTSTNWTPARTNPLNTDILVFNNGADTTVTSVPTQSIAQLSISGGTTVGFQSPSAATLTILGDSGTDLTVASGSTLNINGTGAVNIALATGATGSISGSMSVSIATETLTSADASGITFQSGSVFTQGGTGATGNVFGSGTSNSVVFASGSTFIQNAGANPFQKTQPASVVVFQTGSLYKFQENTAPSFSGRTYANLEINVPALNQSPTGSAVLSIDNLTMTAGTLNLNLTGGININGSISVANASKLTFTPTSAPAPMSIKGDINVASGGTLSFSPAGTPLLNLNGTDSQTISGSGTITFNGNESIDISNPVGVNFQRDLNLAGGIFTLSGSGRVNFGTNAILGNGTPFNSAAGTTIGIGSPDGIVSSTSLGNIRVTGTKNFAAGTTFIYNGSSNQTVGNLLPTSVANLIIANTGSAGNNTVTGSSTQTVTSLLRVQQGNFSGAGTDKDVQIDSSGTLSASGITNVSGNWSNNGTFNANSNAVVLNGASQSVSGQTSFYSLTKSTATATTLTFEAGKTQTITNSLTLNGASGNLLALRSSTPGTRWKLVAPSVQSVNFVDAQDSDASGGSSISQTNSVDSGNNVNWNFSVPTQPMDYFRSKASGNWSATSTWESSADNSTWIAATLTPTSAANRITIQSGHTVDIDSAVTVDQVVVSSGSTLVTGNGNLTVNDGIGTDLAVAGNLKVDGAVTNNGQISIINLVEVTTAFPSFSGAGSFTWDPAASLGYTGTSTLTLSNTASTAMFWPATGGPQNFNVLPGGGADVQVPRTLGTVSIFAGFYSGQNLTINNTLFIGFGGQVSGGPTYGPQSQLIYDLGGHQANRGGEWTVGATSGSGYPHDVQVVDTTTLWLGVGSPVSPLQMSGKLTVENGSFVDMAGMFAPLNVAGGIQLDGTLRLSASGGDFHLIGGDWARSNTGLLLGAGRPVYFDSTGDQTIYNDNNFDALVINATTARTVKFEAGKTQSAGQSVSIAGAAGNLVSLRSTVDGTRWKLNSLNFTTATYTDVKDSDATGSAGTINPTNSVDSGNNVNWNFPVPATVAFSSGSYTVAEGTSQVALTLTRGGSSSTAFSVDLATTNGTATSGSCGDSGADYTSLQTTVSFASGEASKVVNIPVCSDDLTESPAETFTATLSNATNGITLGPVNPATIKIVDAATEFTNAVQLDAGPNQVVSSDVIVSGYVGNVSGMRVTLFGVTANNADDMDVLLVDPAGHKYALVGDVGGSSSLNNATLTFEDNGSAGFMPNSTAISEGANYKPTDCESPFTDMTGSVAGPVVEPGCGPTLTNSFAGTFGGQNPNGAWTLYLRNDAGSPLGVSNVSISGWGVQFIAPTAAPVTLSGRVVNMMGQGIRGAAVTISGGDLEQPNSVRTDGMGRYSFEGLHPAQTYIVSVRAKGMVIDNATRPVTLFDDLSGINFVAQPRE